MQSNDDYKNDKADVFLFPDEDRYQRQITNVLTVPLDIKVEVRDENGKILNIDEQH